jgi:hypothetical protein
MSVFHLHCLLRPVQVEAAAQEVVKELRTGLEEGVTAVAPSAVGTLSLTELAARAEKGLEVGEGTWGCPHCLAD